MLNSDGLGFRFLCVRFNCGDVCFVFTFTSHVNWQTCLSGLLFAYACCLKLVGAEAFALFMFAVLFGYGGFNVVNMGHLLYVDVLRRGVSLRLFCGLGVLFLRLHRGDVSL